MEFQERIAQGKKTKECRRRPKKVQNGKSVEEVEHKLQQLLIDIEKESTTKRFDFLTKGPVLEEASAQMQDDPTQQELNLEAKLDSKTRKATDLGCSSTAALSFCETEVIDLMSPSPLVNARYVSKSSKCKEVDVMKCIDVIDLAESENEISPEHARKARELRLFIASIKDD